jgi:hypothetical protein
LRISDRGYAVVYGEIEFEGKTASDPRQQRDHQAVLSWDVIHMRN